jgi:hypothetical protein
MLTLDHVSGNALRQNPNSVEVDLYDLWIGDEYCMIHHS